MYNHLQFLHLAKSLIAMVILIFVSGNMNAQVLNDDCKFAIAIPKTDNYCSNDGQFSNVGAKADPSFPAGTAACISLKWSNGVWFSFVPKQPAVLIRVFGSGNGGTMKNPKIILFENCNTYLTCSPGKDVGTDELVFDNLTIGQTYFILVESATDGTGTFKLCVDDFVPVKSPESDCNKAVVLCDKTPFVVNELEGNGVDKNELDKSICIGGEYASAWYKWTCDSSGSLTFELTPNNNLAGQITDDIDFALYELPNGIDDCSTKTLLRCEGAGANTTATGAVAPLSQWSKCNGPTGLKVGETDISEPGGCQGANNNYVSPINMISGKSYVLIINNFSRSGLGFGIEFGGSGTFLGPKPDFEVNQNKAFECDKSVVIINKSTSETDPIVKYTWNLGDRSVPKQATGEGPLNVYYESFGQKISALTVESSRGCTVTKIVDFYVEPCCRDTSTLAVDAVVYDLACFNVPEGRLVGQGISGAPEYKYSLEGSQFQPSPQFGNLSAGSYLLLVQDIKGCTDSIEALINQPPPITVNAGPDQEIELGDSTIINLTYNPNKGNDSIIWEPPLTLDANGNFVSYARNTTTYTVTVIDSNGCVGQSEVEIRVVKNLKFYAPNIFSPINKDGSNDFFNVWTSKGAEKVELLEVYDRWGNLVYQGIDGINFARNSTASGWDGRFKSLDVVPGVFVWVAKILWLDGTRSTYSGDVTVLR